MYTKITKKEARKRFESGQSVYVLASKMHPDNMWMKPAEMSLYDDNNQYTFDSFINSYMYYNCNTETGMRVAFYKK